MEQILLGPIKGMISDSKAKIWLYASCNENAAIPFCHVFFKGSLRNVFKSPFVFQALPIKAKPFCVNNNLYKAFLAEIDLPKDQNEFTYGVSFSKYDIAPSDIIYDLKKPQKNQDEEFSFGLISCHKPKTKNLEVINEMWEFLYDKMKEKNASFLIQAGDQIYCDSDRFSINAWKKCLEIIRDVPVDQLENYHGQMVDLYRQVYYDSWNFLGVRKVMSFYSQYMIWDDHEIADGWGSKNEHQGEKEQSVFRAAKEAYIEFQHCHNPESLRSKKLYYTFNYGSAAFLVLDLRGERNLSAGILLGDNQRNDIEHWLGTVNDSKILFVVSSVPVVHLSREFFSLAKTASRVLKEVGDDVDDQWTSGSNHVERQWLFEKLLEWSGELNKPVIILGGDVHVGTEVHLNKLGSGKKIYQITSSPITNDPSWLLDYFSAPFSSKFDLSLDLEKKIKMQAEFKRRHRKRNFAIIEVKFVSGKPSIKLNMYRQGEKKPKISELL